MKRRENGRMLRVALVLMAMAWAAGCTKKPAIAPPTVRYGAQACAACQMTVDDERFAAALIEEYRGIRLVHVYDDIGCMIDDEKHLAGHTILARYVHDYRTREWLDAAASSYLKTKQVQTPMGSGILAFAFRGDAEAQAKTTPGEALAFAALWGVKDAGDRPPAVAVASAAPKPAAVVAGNAEAGKAHFNMICIACHGPGGVGIANLGLPLNTSPFVASKTDEQLLAFIKVGRMPTDKDAKTKVPMPPKGGNPAFTDAQLLDVIAYIRTLQEEARRSGAIHGSAAASAH